MKTFTFTFTEEQINILAAGLGELPLKHSNPVLQDMSKQLQEQQEDMPAKTAE